MEPKPVTEYRYENGAELSVIRMNEMDGAGVRFRLQGPGESLTVILPMDEAVRLAEFIHSKPMRNPTSEPVSEPERCSARNHLVDEGSVAITRHFTADEVMDAVCLEYSIDRDTLTINDKIINSALYDCRGICYDLLLSSSKLSGKKIADLFHRTPAAILQCVNSHRIALKINKRIWKKRTKIELALHGKKQ